MQRAQAQPVLDLTPRERLAAAVIPHDPYCPVCAPDDEDAAELCPVHFEERWPSVLAVAA